MGKVKYLIDGEEKAEGGCRLCILAFYLLFLHETGQRVRGKLWVFLQDFVVLEVHVCLKRCLFCLCRFPVGFQLMAAVALF